MPPGNMEVVKYDIVNKTFTNLTNDAQGELRMVSISDRDTSKLLYWDGIVSRPL